MSWKWQPSCNARWQTKIGVLKWHHWIAGTLKHGYRHQNHISICSRSRFMAKNVILAIQWWPFWKWHQTGSSSLNIFVGIHFSCSIWSREQNKTGLILSWAVHSEPLSMSSLHLSENMTENELKMAAILEFKMADKDRCFVMAPLDCWYLKTWV